jgi:hypothetical protein
VVSTGRAFLVYTSLRIVLLLAVGGLLYLTGLRGFLLVLLAFLLSGALSLVWLDRPRSQMGAGFGRAIGKVNERIDRAAAAEDPGTLRGQSGAEAQSDAEAEPDEQKAQ